MIVIDKTGGIFEVIKELEDRYQIKPKKEFMPDGIPTKYYEFYIAKSYVKEIIDPQLDTEKWHKHFDSCCEELKLSNGFIQTHLIKCPYCGGENLEEKNYDYIENIITEFDYYCKDCKEIVGGWAYGNAHD